LSVTWYSYNLPNAINGPSSNSSQFFYGPDRARWKQVASYSGTSEQTIYIGGLIEKVALGADTHWKHYIAGGTGVVAEYIRHSTGTNETVYLLKDHLGSTEMITNSSGAQMSRLSFDSWGRRRNGGTWNGNPASSAWTTITNTTRHGFTSHEMLDNLNLVHMNGRVYDQIIGRFMSADAFIDDGAATQGWNRYSYVRGNPLSSWDPSGYDSEKTIVNCQNCDKGGPMSLGDMVRNGYGTVSQGMLGYATHGTEFTYADGGRTGAGTGTITRQIDLGYRYTLFRDTNPGHQSTPQDNPGPGPREFPGGPGGGPPGQPAPKDDDPPPAQQPPPTQCSSTQPVGGGNHLSTGVAVHVATVNPVSSGHGSVSGYNWQDVPGAESRHYSYTGNGVGLDVGASVQSVWAYGSGAWTGDFHSVSVSLSRFSASYFWSPGGGGWKGITFGLGVGLPVPQGAYEETTYSMHCTAADAVQAATGL
jgi:RHS repeat-associated protein